MNSRPFCINHPVRTFWVILSKRTLAVLRLWRWALLPYRCWALCSHVPWASLFDTNIKTCELTFGDTKGDSVFLYLFNVTMLPVYEVHCSIKLDWMRCFIKIKYLYIKKKK
uniref:Secreted protein n=1 Tax=Cacopsylla melanoneura TaxID=428564 RepID=A0A8D9F602_9HEMI